jgi:hypothetical protein
MQEFELSSGASADTGRVLLLRPTDGWVQVGRLQGPDLSGDRAAHWRHIAPFAIPRDPLSGRPQPFLGLDRAKPLFASGAYAEHRHADQARLRWPDAICSPMPPSGGARVLGGLHWAEAELLCRLAGGRLAGETEVELIARELGADLDWPPAVWSATPFSAFAYDWCAYDAARDRWFAAADRRLPDVREPAERYALFRWDVKRQDLRRQPGCRDPIPAADSDPLPNKAAAMLVFDLDG